MDERLYWIWLAEALGQGSVWASLLVRKYGGARAVYEGGPDLPEADGEIRENIASMLRGKLKNRSLTRAEDIAARCDSRGIVILTCDSPAYPGTLRTLRDMPLVLYVLGQIPPIADRLTAAVVGTRKMSDYGRRIAYSLGAGLAFGGATVVSGMALGADSMALTGALDAGGAVAAVLGSGVDIVYPPEHGEIYHRILENGAVMSEYPPGSPPVGSHFPVRNRIMSGLSDAAVVVEAGRGSGALITAKLALEQGRRLFAVPGRVGDEGAEGTNDLIREGALPVIHPEDVLSEFAHIYKTVNLPLAHARMRDLNFEELSLVAMQRTRIGARGGEGRATAGSPGTRSRDLKETARNRADEKFRRAVQSEKGTEKPAETAAAPESRKIRTAPKPDPAAKAEKSPAPEKKANDFERSEKQTVNSAKNFVPAQKTDIDMLDESEMKVYNKMKPNVPTLPDELVDASTPIGAVLSALTVLELTGAVESGSGGYFMRVEPDDIMLSENS
ncbi:MAG: DNA-protecting protein DprA [Ruminococcaceae bacterium]|jgi:DNA processing protein|nr:DNA-protecting protein DprA [Oscillospiraceae bacterium]